MIKLKNILLEKKDLDSKHIEKISKMTDRNNHLGARTYLSYLLGGTKSKLRQYYDAASQINVVFGHTPPELSKLNQKMEKQLYKDIKKQFSNAKEIIGAL